MGLDAPRPLSPIPILRVICHEIPSRERSPRDLLPRYCLSDLAATAASEEGETESIYRAAAAAAAKGIRIKPERER